MSQHPAARVRVPKDLAEVTCIDRDAECRPSSAGMTAAGVARIWHAVERWYRTGLQPAITLVLRRRGRIVMKRSIGALAGNLEGERGPLVPLTPEAPICLWSSSKAISALLVHKLVDQGQLSLDAPVSRYVPEFGAHGKHVITVRQLLTHRAAIPRLPKADGTLAIPVDWDDAIARICAIKPVFRDFQTKAYHAITAGYILCELARRVSGVAPAQALREWIAQPLQCSGLGFGLPPERRALAPRSIRTGSLPRALALVPERGLGMSIDHAIELANSDAFHGAVIPSANLYATADDASRIYQMLLDGGTFEGARIFRPATVAAMRAPAGHGLTFDRTLGIPMKYSAGFMLGGDPIGLYGRNCGSAFGHLGFLTVIAWADPARDISVALLSNGKSVLPAALVRWAQIMGTVSAECPRS